MKIAWKHLVLIAIVLTASACGKDSNNNAVWLPPPEESTITIYSQSDLASNPVGTTYRGKIDTNPSLASLVTPSSLSMSVIKEIGVDVDLTFNLSTKGVTVNDYTLGDGSTTLTYWDHLLTKPEVKAYGTSGTISITEVGSGEGKPIKGSFDTEVNVTINSNPSGTMRMWGTFSILRAN